MIDTDEHGNRLTGWSLVRRFLRELRMMLGDQWGRRGMIALLSLGYSLLIIALWIGLVP